MHMEEISRVETNNDLPLNGVPDASEAEEDPGAARLAPTATRALGAVGISELGVDRAKAIMTDTKEDLRPGKEWRTTRPLPSAIRATRGYLAGLRHADLVARRGKNPRTARTVL
jgi:hypothetical protein